MAPAATRTATVILALIGFVKLIQDGIHTYTTTGTHVAVDADFFTDMSSSQKRIMSKQAAAAQEKARGRLLLCDRINAHESLESMWQHAQAALKDGTLRYTNKEIGFGKIIQSNPDDFQDWMKESINYFTIPRLKRSILQQAPTRHMKRVIQIINRRLQFLQQNPSFSSSSSSSNSSSFSSSVPPPPLHVLVTGGSVTTGVQCLHNSLDRSGSVDFDDKFIPQPECAWPGRLQEILDSLLGKDVVVVTNMAHGGTTSAIAALVLEHRLFPPGYPAHGPDIIIWDHGANDLAERLPEMDMFESLLQPYYQATRRCRRCNPKTHDDSQDDQQPLVIYLDSMLGNAAAFSMAYTANAISTSVYRMVTWYSNVMGISYANTMRPYILSNYEPQAHYRLLGSELIWHPGMMYHMTIAWVVLFNLLDSLRDACNLDGGEHHEHESYYNQKRAHPPDLNHQVLSASDIPELSSALKMDQVLPQWKERVKKTNITCSQGKKGNAGNQCAYIWILNRLLAVNSQDGLLQMIQPFLSGVDRWSTEGVSIGKPNLGWVANGRGAWFELTIPITTKDNTPVRSFTLVAMKSWSHAWINSSLNVTATVVTTNNNNSSSSSSGNNGTTATTTASSTASSLVSGHHTLRTSVWFPHKFDIPTAVEGDTVQLRFQLVDGATFKIRGMALCAT
jgi:hypothetical protein